MPTNYDCVLKKALIESEGSSNKAEAEEDIFDQKEKDQKRRKLTRGLRKYTGVASEGERKTKGWSDKGMEAFEMRVGAIMEDVNDNKQVCSLGESLSWCHEETRPLQERH